MALTVGDLITESAVMTGQVALGDPVPPEISAYGFRKLADLVDVMKTNRLLMYRRQRVGPFSVTSGQGDITAASPITIGTGATWNTPRPTWIDGAGVIYTAGSTPRPELPMHVFTVKEWQGVTVKGITSTLSRALIYDQNYTSSGYGHIYLYPVPSASFQVVLYVPIAVEEFASDANGNPDYTTAIALPPGYRPMLIANLAMVMCIGVAPISDDLRAQANDTMAHVKASNVVQTMDALSCDEATQSSRSQGTGWDYIGGGFT